MTLLADDALLVELLLAIVLMPLAASVLLVFFGRRLPRPDWLATASIGAGAYPAQGYPQQYGSPSGYPAPAHQFPQQGGWAA